MNQTKILLLDFGGVVFNIDIESFFEWIKTKQSETVLNLRQKMEQTYAEYEKGALSTTGYLNKLRNELKLKFSDEEFNEQWCAIWREDVKGMTQLIHDMSQKIPVYGLSNSNEIHAEQCISTKPQLQKMNKIFLSHELGLAKPDVEIYKVVLTEIKCDPEQVYFFDDLDANVQAARQLGIQAYVFESAEQIRELLAPL